MRMAPAHVKRNIWWELLFVGVLLYLFVSMKSENKRELAAAAQVTLTASVAKPGINPIVAVAQAVIVPAIQLGAIVPSPVAPLVLEGRNL